jgi:hypothetical protein
VATRFLAAVRESSGPGMNMAFFISCDPDDVMRQAEESTLRYQRGNVLYILLGLVHFPSQPKIFPLSLITSNLSTYA